MYLDSDSGINERPSSSLILMTSFDSSWFNNNY